MAFHCVFNDYSGVEFNYQKYTIKVLGAILLLVKLSSLIKIYLRGGKTIFRGAECPPCTPLKKNLTDRCVSLLSIESSSRSKEGSGGQQMSPELLNKSIFNKIHTMHV
jgi:hypothetical protein